MPWNSNNFGETGIPLFPVPDPRAEMTGVPARPQAVKTFMLQFVAANLSIK